MSSIRPKPQRPRRFSTQIRIRLLPEESHVFEQRRLEELQEGKAYAQTLSTWVRHQLEPIIHPVTDKEECRIPKELRDVAASRAQALGMEPEAFIERCILEIIHMASRNRPGLPAIVKDYRKKMASNRAA